eukprot:scaffold2761_cov391-Prasinococcus_capsulatus_cf.AAC.11
MANGDDDRFGTPTYGILLSALGVVVLGPLSFGSVVEMLNFLYCIAALLEFSAFVWLRHKRPDLQRPFKVPLGTVVGGLPWEPGAGCCKCNGVLFSTGMHGTTPPRGFAVPNSDEPGLMVNPGSLRRTSRCGDISFLSH